MSIHLKQINIGKILYLEYILILRICDDLKSIEDFHVCVTLLESTYNQYIFIYNIIVNYSNTHTYIYINMSSPNPISSDEVI